MNIPKHIPTWQSLHSFLCWAEWIGACLCVVMVFLAASLPGGSGGLEIAITIIGIVLAMVWIPHAVTLVILKNYNQAYFLRSRFGLFLLTVGLCVGFAACHVPLTKARFALSRGALESAVERADDTQSIGWIGLYRIGKMKRAGDMVEFLLSGAGNSSESYYLIYAPGGLGGSMGVRDAGRYTPEALGENWWYVRERLD